MIDEETVVEHSNENAEAEPSLMKYWRSAEQREISPEYIQSLQDEYSFPAENDKIGVDRRDMLKLMGASLALAGVSTACRRPDVKIMPYTRQPEQIVPGLANYFATAMPGRSDAVGIVVESHEGRPTKIEGNSLHPSSLGAASFQAQAAILQLYDPDRSRRPIREKSGLRKDVSWGEWDDFSSQRFAEADALSGAGMAFILGAPNSPTTDRLLTHIQKKFPQAQWCFFDPLYDGNSAQAAKTFFGRQVAFMPVLDKATTILCVQADPLMSGDMNLRLARQFASGRKIYSATDASKMNRLYVAESGYSVTGSNADHRISLASTESIAFLSALAYQIFVVQKMEWPAELGTSKHEQFKNWTGRDKKYDAFLRGVAKDLISNRGKALVLVGEDQGPAAHALAFMINTSLKGLNRTYELKECVRSYNHKTDGLIGLTALVEQMNKGKINTLVIADANPVYSSPGALNFSSALDKVGERIHVGMYEDETARRCNWHLPLSHFLENWGDTRAYDGTASIVQPLIAPLHESRSLIEVLSQIGGAIGFGGYDLVQATWRGEGSLLADQSDWDKALHDGVIVASASKAFVPAAYNSGAVFELLASSYRTLGDKVELVFRADYRVVDGSLANLGWLQELPDPVTKLTWGNALFMGPALARKLGIKSGVKKKVYEAEVARVKFGSSVLEAPVFVLPGLAENSLTVNFGYGRTQAGYVGNGIGFDVFSLWPKNGDRYPAIDSIEPLKRFEPLASTQEQFAMNGDVVQETDLLSLQNRDPARSATAGYFSQHPDYVKEKGIPKDLTAVIAGSDVAVPVSITEPWPYKDNKWGMVIDLTSCIGCNACVTACQSENNVPVVGPEQVMRGRSMHWLRVDRYFTGSPDSPETIVQPVPCQHCENAPCEPVCPVAATVHDTEGLNAMTYNRCIGTRYCANNCPYKVRRFNYFDYTHSGNLYVNPVDKKRQKLTQMGKNPDVTIRYRGVMEKCSYCTQRIQEAKMSAIRKHQDPNKLPDNAVVPACAQTCPTNAIAFGNLNAPNSRVAELKRGSRNYVMLEELNTRPRTSYLSKLRNPNPELV